MGLLDLIRGGKKEKDVARAASPYVGTSMTFDQLMSVLPTEITGEGSLSVAAVYACIKVISDTMSTMNRNHYKHMGPHRENDLKHKYNHLLEMPAKNLPWSAFMKVVYNQKFIDGNSKWIIERDRNLNVVLLHYRRKGEVLTYYNNEDLWYYDTITGQVLDPMNVFHIKDVPSTIPWEGRSRLDFHGNTIGKIKAADDLQNKLSTSGLTLGGFVVYPKETDADDPAILAQEKNFHKNHQGRDRAGKWAFFGGGPQVTPVPPSMTLSDAQIIAATHLAIEDVCRMFSVPPHKIYHLIRSTFNNIEHLQIDYTSGAILPEVVAFEEEWNWKILNMDPVTGLKMEIDSLMRADSLATIRAISEGIKNSILTPNEGRALMNRNPKPGGDELLYPANNLSPLKNVNNVQGKE